MSAFTGQLLPTTTPADPAYRLAPAGIADFSALDFDYNIWAARTAHDTSVQPSGPLERVALTTIDNTIAGQLTTSWLHAHWLDTFFLTAREVDFSFVSGAAEISLPISSLFREPRAVTAITANGLDSVEITHGDLWRPVAVGTQWQAFEEKILKIKIDEEAAANIDGQIRFDFKDSYFILTITATLSVLWNYLPDWAQGVRETLSYKTAILLSQSGREQRARARMRPRYGLTFASGAFGQRPHILFNKLFSESQSRAILAPLVNNAALVKRVEGTAVFVEELKNRRFQAGPIIALNLSGEAAVLAATNIDVEQNRIDLKSAPKAHYVAGDYLFPAHSVRLPQSVRVERFTGSASTGTFTFASEQAPLFIPYMPAQVFLNLPVIGDRALFSWQAAPTLEYQRRLLLTDYTIGPIRRVDRAKQNFTRVNLLAAANGRTQITQLLSLIDYLAGQLNPIWVVMPTAAEYEVDHFLQGTKTLITKTMPYATLDETNRNLYITTTIGAPHFVRLSSFDRRPDGLYNLNAHAPFTYSAAAAAIASCQQLRLCRLASDDIEINYSSPEYATTTLSFYSVPASEAAQVFTDFIEKTN